MLRLVAVLLLVPLVLTLMFALQLVLCGVWGPLFVAELLLLFVGGVVGRHAVSGLELLNEVQRLQADVLDVLNNLALPDIAAISITVVVVVLFVIAVVIFVVIIVICLVAGRK